MGTYELKNGEMLRERSRSLGQSAMAPRLSIVIPVRNCLPSLPTAVDSIRKQRLDAVEIVVIGDRSTDALDRWLAQVSKRDARLKWSLGPARVLRRRALLALPRATRLPGKPSVSRRSAPPASSSSR